MIALSRSVFIAKIITHGWAYSPYLERLHKEVAIQAALVSDQRLVNQLHFGGGTPPFLSDEQLQQLMLVTRAAF